MKRPRADTRRAMNMVGSQKYNSGFSLGLMRKDLTTALQLANDLHVDLPMAEHFVGIWQRAENLLGKNADHTEIARLVEDLANG